MPRLSYYTCTDSSVLTRLQKWSRHTLCKLRNPPCAKSLLIITDKLRPRGWNVRPRCSARFNIFIICKPFIAHFSHRCPCVCFLHGFLTRRDKNKNFRIFAAEAHGILITIEHNKIQKWLCVQNLSMLHSGKASS